MTTYYQCDMDGILTGSGIAQPNPKGEGSLLPAYATLIEPPSIPGGYLALFDFDSEEWSLVIESDNYKYKRYIDENKYVVIYRVETGKDSKIYTAGKIEDHLFGYDFVKWGNLEATAENNLGYSILDAAEDIDDVAFNEDGIPLTKWSGGVVVDRLQADIDIDIDILNSPVPDGPVDQLFIALLDSTINIINHLDAEKSPSERDAALVAAKENVVVLTQIKNTLYPEEE